MTVTETTTPDRAPAGDPRDELREWRAEREATLREPHGWLSLVGLTFLAHRPTAVPGVPGLWWTDGHAAYVRAGRADGVSLPGAEEVLDGTAEHGVAEGRSATVATFLPADRAGGDVVAVELLRRTGRLGVRVRDPLAPARTGFTGVRAYAYDPGWVLDVPVRWYDATVTATVGAAQRGLVHEVRLVGEVDVERDGVRATLRLTEGHAHGTATLLLSDEADDVAPWRVLGGVPVDTSGDTVRLDLNRVVNLPYAFSDFGTCPAPVPGNHAPFAIDAGEKTPGVVRR